MLDFVLLYLGLSIPTIILFTFFYKNPKHSIEDMETFKKRNKY